jgi:hypothetical protein
MQNARLAGDHGKAGVVKGEAYGRLAETFCMDALRLLPTAVKPATAAIEIRAAMRPYSMAVAPCSSFRKSLMKVIAGFL